MLSLFKCGISFLAIIKFFFIAKSVNEKLNEFSETWKVITTKVCAYFSQLQR